MLFRLTLIAALLTGCSPVPVADVASTAPEPVTQPRSRSAAATTTPADTIQVAQAASTAVPSACPSAPALVDPNPWGAAAALALEHPGWSGVEASVSVWVEDAGEVFAVNPDLRLFPASNQKIVTAVGAFMLLDLDSGFHTSVEERSGELIVRAGGDPTLLTNGPHSLKALAAQVADNASGDFVRLVIDAGHFERRVTVLGRLDWQLPTYTGPLSGFIVDDNRWTTDPAFLANPALVNGQRFAEALDREGIGISEVVHIDNYGLLGGNVASLESEPAAALIPTMMKSSDNEIAESLLREMGAGSTATGVVEVQRVLTSLCLSGSAGDGSGLSRANLISARELRRILQFAMNQEWGDQFYQSFPVAGLSGTMATRLTGIATSGNVRAKTGTIIGGRALSGFASTTDDRFMTFSVITNGDAGAAAASAAAIDALVTALTSVRP